MEQLVGFVVGTLWPNVDEFASRQISVPCALEDSFALPVHVRPVELPGNVGAPIGPVCFEFRLVARKCIVAIRTTGLDDECLILLHALDRLNDTHPDTRSVLPVVRINELLRIKQLNDLNARHDGL
jgi:hypothetical protein